MVMCAVPPACHPTSCPVCLICPSATTAVPLASSSPPATTRAPGTTLASSTTVAPGTTVAPATTKTPDVPVTNINLYPVSSTPLGPGFWYTSQALTPGK
ncbi:g5360 [Coccomyxa elongata]